VELVQAPSVNPSINFEPPKPCEMDSFVVDLQFTGSGVDSIAWIMGDGAIFTTNAVHYLYSTAGTYNIVLMVYNELCPHDPVSLGEIQFLEIKETSGIIPNVFTPNGDNWNDELVFVGIDNTQDYSIRIFDRWGRLAYASTDATKHWDGKDASEGTYFYELRYTDVCSSEEKLKTGTVTLLRGPKK
jgi:gliding motility-associated-like protein